MTAASIPSSITEGGIIQNDPTIHALVAKDKADLNGAADYYTLNYTAPEGAEYAKKYINGINGMIEGIWGAKVSTLYVACIDDTISVITHAPIKSVNGVAYNRSCGPMESATLAPSTCASITSRRPVSST